MIAWFAGVALAQECRLDGLSSVPDSLAVAWVSPVTRRVNNRTWLHVVPTSALRERAAQGDLTVARTLQWMGLRASPRPPWRRYKVVVFDVARADLCRPVLGAADVAGVKVCDPDHSGPKGDYAGCGELTDLATGRPSTAVYSAQWQTLSHDGFCVLPLQRFLERAAE